MIRFKIKLAIRSLLKNKVYSALIIGGFSIGFTACILIGLYYNAEHNVNKNFPNYRNTYRLYDIERNTFNLDYKLSQVFTKKYPEIEDACPVEYTSGYQFTIKDAGTKVYTQIDDLICTTNNFFHIFSVEVVESLSENPFNDWFHVKIEVAYPGVLVYVNGSEEATLQVQQISKRDNGKIGLWVGNGSEGWFKNLTLISVK